MKNLKPLLILLAIVIFNGCSSSDDEKPITEKNVTILVTLDGDYSDYLVNFSVHSMLSGKSDFIAPVLVEPSTEWTQIISQGNAYNLTLTPIAPQIEAKSSSKIHSLGFVFNAVHGGSSPSDNFTPLTATIQVLADGIEIKSYSYTAMPAGQTSVPLAENISVN